MGHISNWCKRTIKGNKVDLEKEVRSLHELISELKMAVALVTQDKKNDKATVNELKKDMEALTIALNRFNLTLENKAGFSEGKSTVMKWVWTIFGGLVCVWVVWITSTTADCSADLKSLKKQIEKKELSNGT